MKQRSIVKAAFIGIIVFLIMIVLSIAIRSALLVAISTTAFFISFGTHVILADEGEGYSDEA